MRPLDEDVRHGGLQRACTGATGPAKRRRGGEREGGGSVAGDENQRTLRKGAETNRCAATIRNVAFALPRLIKHSAPFRLRFPSTHSVHKQKPWSFLPVWTSAIHHVETDQLLPKRNSGGCVFAGLKPAPHMVARGETGVKVLCACRIIPNNATRDTRLLTMLSFPNLNSDFTCPVLAPRIAWMASPSSEVQRQKTKCTGRGGRGTDERRNCRQEWTSCSKKCVWKAPTE